MELTTFRNQLFAEGEKLGFTDLELYYEKQESFSCDIFKGEIDGFESSTVNGVSLRGLYDGKMGYAYTEKLDEDSVRFLLDSVKENAALIEDEPEEIYAGDTSYREMDFYSSSLSEVTTVDKIAFMKEVEKKIYAYDSRVVQTDYATLQDATVEKALFNSKGLSLSDRNNILVVIFSVVVKEEEELKSDFHVTRTQDFKSLDPNKIAAEAVEKALSYLGGKTYPNKKYSIIFKNSAAASLLATFVPSLSAEAVQKDQSLLKGKLNEDIASSHVTLTDDPFLSNSIHSGTFDSEGVATKQLTVVENGKLESYFHNLKTAKKDGVASTGHGHKPSYKDTIGISPSNLFIQPGEEAYEDLYEDLEEGIIITNLAGLHSGANVISGDFSLAANGYYVKAGKIVGPTNQMTIAGNFFEILHDIEQVGSDLEFAPMSAVGNIGSPSLKVKRLSIAVD
ncbi:TldD/PmbA family protein [Virgibacillus sp. C22-A2]|uniref:TldD/PmbA family protein n=1 Tax=Virgibacillus tibetensis TaxID=3042313 RepID=A0ABU6KCP4_9BACI|nr:TldD/PmbA family protein [Virgibacillus sp. C22-A2]